jgi:hypothetical protein
MKVMWVECQSTGDQLSPEFSSRKGMIYWLEFEGLRRGWLKVVSYDGYHGHMAYYKECQ